jgi:serine protease Do
VARKGGKRATISVPLQRAKQTVATATPESATPSRRSTQPETTSMPSLGVTVAPLDASTTRSLEIPADVRGVVVMDVDDSSPAAGRLATPQTGGPDIILSMEGRRVTTPDSLRAALRSAKPGEIVSLRVYNAQAKNRRFERIRLGGATGR